MISFPAAVPLLKINCNAASFANDTVFFSCILESRFPPFHTTSTFLLNVMPPVVLLVPIQNTPIVPPFTLAFAPATVHASVLLLFPIHTLVKLPLFIVKSYAVSRVSGLGLYCPQSDSVRMLAVFFVVPFS